MEYVVCLYGNGPEGCGAGWLASTPKGLLGTGEPVLGVSFPEAVHQALQAVEQKMEQAYPEATVTVFAPGGEQMATYPFELLLSQPHHYHKLSWGPATVYAVSAANVLAASNG